MHRSDQSKVSIAHVETKQNKYGLTQARYYLSFRLLKTCFLVIGNNVLVISKTDGRG